MLLTLSTTHQPATDLGYLLHKHPDKVQSFELSFGKAHVFYPEVSTERCTACLMIDVDAIGMVRGKNPEQNFLLAPYVNDRAYVASSFLSVAIAQVFGSALQGRSKDRPLVADSPIPLEAHLDVLSVRGGEKILRAMFEPLGYTVEVTPVILDEKFPEWGPSTYYSVVIRNRIKLSDLLTHLYVLIPVFDNRKHYFVGDDEVQKLLTKGEGWLAAHPEKEEIARRYLGFRSSLYREAIRRLVLEEEPEETDDEPSSSTKAEEILEAPISLNEQRLASVAAIIRATGGKRILDVGCGEGKLLRELLPDRTFEALVGMDVSVRALEIAARRLRLSNLPDHQAKRLTLLHGSLMYRDRRLEGFDVASVVEVIEHLDPPRLKAFERVLFEFAKPRTIVLTTPNREYNVMWPSLPAGCFRHADHRFEWTRAEFQSWATEIGKRFGYTIRFHSIGPEDGEHGSPTQMAVFERIADR